MSAIATASGVRVRAARAVSSRASRSQVPALSRPVLASIREASTSWAWRKERCSNATRGRAPSAMNGLAGGARGAPGSDGGERAGGGGEEGAGAGGGKGGGVQGGGRAPPLHQGHPGDWHQERVQGREQESERQLPDRVHVLDQARGLT